MPRLKSRGILLPAGCEQRGFRFPNRGERKAYRSPPPRRRRFTAAQKARERQNVARVRRVVRKMAPTLESI
jgi:hypothetical protein